MANDLLLKLVARFKDEASAGAKTMGRAIDRALAAPRKGVTALKDAFFNVKTAIIAAAGSLSLFKVGGDIVSAAADLEVLRARLDTVTGSAEKGGEAFERVKRLASKDIPLTLAELTEAYIKLTALGLEPSENALISYANTATAMGKSLDQFVEAIADATTGEFERLKEFGIKASAEGQRVAFTFQGVTTEVGKSAGEIEAYLRGLGNTKFAGAMAKQAKTFRGILKSIQKAYTDVLNQLAEGGLFEYIKEKLADIQTAIEYAIASGKFREWGEKIGEAVTNVGSYIEAAGRVISGFIGGVRLALNGITAAFNAVAGLVSGFLASVVNATAKALDFFGADKWAAQAREISASLQKVSDDYLDALREDRQDIVDSFNAVTGAMEGGKDELTDYMKRAREWKASAKNDIAEPAEQAAESMEKVAETTKQARQALQLIQGEAGKTKKKLGEVGGDLDSTKTVHELLQIAYELQKLYKAGDITKEQLSDAMEQIMARMRDMADTAYEELMEMRKQFREAESSADGLADSVGKVKDELRGVGSAAAGAAKAMEEPKRYTDLIRQALAATAAEAGLTGDALAEFVEKHLSAMWKAWFIGGGKADRLLKQLQREAEVLALMLDGYDPFAKYKSPPQGGDKPGVGPATQSALLATYQPIGGDVEQAVERIGDRLVRVLEPLGNRPVLLEVDEAVFARVLDKLITRNEALRQ